MSNYRHDLAERTRALLDKIESRKTLLQKEQKQLAAALAESAWTGKYFDMGPGNARCLSLTQEIVTAERELAGITEEKRRLLADAGLAVETIYISLNELPTTQSEYNIRLHG